MSTAWDLTGNVWLDVHLISYAILPLFILLYEETVQSSTRHSGERRILLAIA